MATGELGGHSSRFGVVVLASGRGTNFQALIDATEGGTLPVRIEGLICDQPEAGCLDRARRHGIRDMVVMRSSYSSRSSFEQALADAAAGCAPDLVVLAGFMRILGPAFLGAFDGRVINIHPSLLPAFRGLDAQRQALDYGVRYSGCTVHLVDEGMDTGAIIDQRVVPVMADDTRDSLAARILEEEHRLLVECIRAFAEGRVRRDGRKVTVIPPSPTSGG